jgi:hypothetical protein
MPGPGIPQQAGRLHTQALANTWQPETCTQKKGRTNMYRKHLWLFACLLVTLACFAGGLVTASPAQHKGHAKSGKDAGKAVAVRGEDSNIKRDEGKNSNSAKPKRPARKGGPKARGSIVTLHIDNQTKWYIKIYNNGDYMGTVAPYGDNYYDAETGTHTLYGRADFDDGSVTRWGPRTVYIDDDYTWTLTD